MVLRVDGWFRVIADIFGWMLLDDCGEFWVVADGFWVVSGGFQGFTVLVAMAKFVA